MFSFTDRVVMMNRETLKGAKIEVQTEGMKEYYVTFRDKFSLLLYCCYLFVFQPGGA